MATGLGWAADGESAAQCRVWVWLFDNNPVVGAAGSRRGVVCATAQGAGHPHL